jgi:hypothetical protein
VSATPAFDFCFYSALLRPAPPVVFDAAIPIPPRCEKEDGLIDALAGEFDRTQMSPMRLALRECFLPVGKRNAFVDKVYFWELSSLSPCVFRTVSPSPSLPITPYPVSSPYPPPPRAVTPPLPPFVLVAPFVICFATLTASRLLPLHVATLPTPIPPFYPLPTPFRPAAVSGIIARQSPPSARAAPSLICSAIPAALRCANPPPPLPPHLSFPTDTPNSPLHTAISGIIAPQSPPYALTAPCLICFAILAALRSRPPPAAPQACWGSTHLGRRWIWREGMRSSTV